jgi:phosphatidylserine/phosphatidylglycerophosphate/cardiolipin synthase-like enzyme
MENALLGLIDGAQTGIDIALYGLDRQSIIDGLVAAHSCGVTVRFAGDDEAATAEYSAGYQALTTAGITVITDTTTSKIQHSKFLVIDDSVVWTGSTNFTDTVLASNHAAEFAEMWSASFHEAKIVNTLQHIDYSDVALESYFSPTDLPACEVRFELAKAESTIHFAIFFWTDEVLSDRVIERLAAGVEVYGVWDQLGAANVSSKDEALCVAGARIGIESLPGKVHHKFAVIDVEGEDPVVILGSYNGTDAGAYDNDENTPILHDRDLARAYYAEWERLRATLEPGDTCDSYAVYVPVVIQDYAAP